MGRCYDKVSVSNHSTVLFFHFSFSSNVWYPGLNTNKNITHNKQIVSDYYMCGDTTRLNILVKYNILFLFYILRKYTANVNAKPLLSIVQIFDFIILVFTLKWKCLSVGHISNNLVLLVISVQVFSGFYFSYLFYFKTYGYDIDIFLLPVHWYVQNYLTTLLNR